MTAREKTFAICLQNRGAEDLDVRKIYRVLRDTSAAAAGYLRVIDESGEDYLYPADYFVLVELPQKAERAWTAAGRSVGSRPGSPGRGLQRTERAAGSGERRG